MKTVNRGWLKKQVANGKMEALCNYSFDPMTDGIEYGDKQWRPARLQVREYDENNKLVNDDWIEGMSNFTEWDFKTKSGCAYQNNDGTITLIIHSNESYELRIKAESQQL